MKIKKKNTTIPINGKIVDTENVEDKTSNAPSLRLAEEMIKTLGEDKVKFKTASWNKSVSLNMSIGGFALGLVGTSSVYVLWRNGIDFAYKRIFGSDSLNVSVSEDKNTITFSSNNNFAMSIFYTKGSVDVS